MIILGWDTRWFNWSFGKIYIDGHYLKLMNLFNRHTKDGEHWWGFGILQYGHRHLFYIGHSGVSILWCGKTR